MGKKILVIIICLALLAAGGFAVVALTRPTPKALDPVTQNVEQSAKYLASAEFDGLPPKAKDEYFTKLAAQYQDPKTWRMPSVDFNDEERARLRKNGEPFMEKAMELQINKYFEQPPEKRDAYLDKLIDDVMAAAMANAMAAKSAQSPANSSSTDNTKKSWWRPGRSGGAQKTTPPAAKPPEKTAAARPPFGDGRQEAFSMDKWRLKLESTPPEKRAKFVEFIKQVGKRMEKRGIPRPTGPPSGNPPSSPPPPVKS